MTDHEDHDLHGLLLGILPDGSVQVEDEDCDCPPDCAACEQSPHIVRPDREGA